MGFTLAEVLVTLTIIGIVAALTIPTLVQNITDQQLKTAYKKSFSALSQATLKLADEKGGSLVGVFNNVDKGLSVKNEFAKYLSFIKTCNASSQTNGCWHADGKQYYYTDHHPINTNNLSISLMDWPAGAILSDGAIIIFATGNNSSTCSQVSGNLTSICAYYAIDVNGFKPPNVEFEDIQSGYILKDRIVPRGSNNDYPSINTPNTFMCRSTLLLQ